MAYVAAGRQHIFKCVLARAVDKSVSRNTAGVLMHNGAASSPEYARCRSSLDSALCPSRFQILQPIAAVRQSHQNHRFAHDALVRAQTLLQSPG